MSFEIKHQARIELIEKHPLRFFFIILSGVLVGVITSVIVSLFFCPEWRMFVIGMGMFLMVGISFISMIVTGFLYNKIESNVVGVILGLLLGHGPGWILSFLVFLLGYHASYIIYF